MRKFIISLPRVQTGYIRFIPTASQINALTLVGSGVQTCAGTKSDADVGAIFRLEEQVCNLLERTLSEACTPFFLKISKAERVMSLSKPWSDYMYPIPICLTILKTLNMQCAQSDFSIKLYDPDGNRYKSLKYGEKKNIKRIKKERPTFTVSGASITAPAWSA